MISYSRYIFDRYLRAKCQYQKVFEKGIFLSRKHLHVSHIQKEAFKSYKASYPEAGLYSLPMGGVIIGKQDVYSTTLRNKPKINKSIKQNFSDFLLNRKSPDKWQHISGTVLYLSMGGLENNYYHFFVELYAKYYIFLNSGIDVDYYIVPNRYPFQREFFSIIGIDSKKILSMEETTPVYADTLIFPSSIGNYKKIKEYGYTRYNKQWLPEWLAGAYKYILDNTPKINVSPSQRIYISRKLANYRHVVNESKVINLLSRHGFICVCLEEMQLIEQINLFRNAKYVIAPHGAGLVNMSWCPRNTSILEIYPSRYSDPSMRLQADLLGHDYNFIRSQYDVDYSGDPQKMDLDIDTSLLRDWLHLKNII